MRIRCATLTSRAFADGSWSSKPTGVVIGNSSLGWQGSHEDKIRTATTFAGCRNSGNINGFKSASVRPIDEQGWLSDKSIGTRANKCGGSDWGVMTRSDRSH